MANSKKRCNICRQYVAADLAIRVGSTWVCSPECQTAKLGQRKPRDPKPRKLPKSKVAPGTTKVQVRKDVIARDGDGCLICGKPGPGLHLHRVVYGSAGGLYEPNNCVQLCLREHAAVHANKRVFFPLLENHLAGDRDARSNLILALGY